MIWRPKPGQRVKLRYNKILREVCPHHLATGTVLIAAKGPGPISALVVLDDGTEITVPRGQLFKIRE